MKTLTLKKIVIILALLTLAGSWLPIAKAYDTEDSEWIILTGTNLFEACSWIIFLLPMVFIALTLSKFPVKFGVALTAISGGILTLGYIAVTVTRVIVLSYLGNTVLGIGAFVYPALLIATATLTALSIKKNNKEYKNVFIE